MNIFERGNDVVCSGVSDFSLRDTLDCGQCFRWDEISENTFYGVANGISLTITQNGDEIIFKNTTLTTFDSVWREYFDLSRDYGRIKLDLCADATLQRAAQFAPGIRVLRQEPWETLCSFIISQNNNIKRIKGIVARLCETFGEPMGDVYRFPTAARLAPLTEEDLAPLRCGFRAAYILDAARRVASGEIVLEQLYTMDMQTARETLMTIKGVGPKVAECVLLYGFSRMEAFPIDVWMRRAMEALFPAGLPECAAENAGIAQQYIFHYVRSCPEVLENIK